MYNIYVYNYTWKYDIISLQKKKHIANSHSQTAQPEFYDSLVLGANIWWVQAPRDAGALGKKHAALKVDAAQVTSTWNVWTWPTKVKKKTGHLGRGFTSRLISILEFFLYSTSSFPISKYKKTCNHQSRCDEILFSHKASLQLHSSVYLAETTGGQDIFVCG